MTFDPYQRQVKDEMSSDVLAIESTAPLLTALDRMEEEGVTVLPVVDEGDRCIGVISATDIIRTARNTARQIHELSKLDPAERQTRSTSLVDIGLSHPCVKDIMQFRLKSVKQDMTIAEASREMLWTRFHHLPVVDEERRLVGIISTLDLLAAFVKGAARQGSQDVSENTNSNDPRLP